IKRCGTAGEVQFEPSFDPAKAVAADELRVRKVQGLGHCAPWFEHTGFKVRMHRTASQLLGADPVLFDEMALLKPPHGGMAMPLHQDNAYITYSPPESVIVFWIAIDPARALNGCMRIVPGGHNRGPIAHALRDPSRPQPTKQNETGTVVVADGILASHLPAPEDQMFAELEPGDVLILNSMVPHGTARNDSALNRFALQYHFHASDSRKLAPAEYARRYPGFFGLTSHLEEAGE
ncbi:MAG TPA: phytanoyl-CoA dioxygenase family protein, partial [Polyangiales bacterium]|nr:phytanoyl-CoA dioxygenase family protein [Polyangiales bacterium]